MLQTQVLIVGAGPAGLSAALAASMSGAQVTVIDEQARPGGQFFKQAPESFKVLDRSIMGRGYDRGQGLLKRIEQGKIEVLSETVAWAALEPGLLEVFRQGECQRIKARRIIVATGAYERPVAFPGWTLPGVMTAGAAQTLVKSQWVLPGNRVLVVGAGPFQLPVATQLVKAGTNVVGLLQASSFSGWLKLWRVGLSHRDKVGEMRDYWLTLLRARVPMMHGWTIIEARGKNEVEQAVIARVDDNWSPIAGTEKVLDVDTICLAFGFIPSLQLPRLLGCRVRWDPDIAFWATEHDDDQRTSLNNVLVAGEATGIGGHEVAMAEGIVAGAIAAEDIGFQAADEPRMRLKQIRLELSRSRQFARALNRAFALRPGIYDLVKDDTVICRCEESTAGEIAAAAKEWNGSLRTIKQLTRVTMGHCQGRICGPLVSQIAAKATGRTVEEIGLDSLRPPIKPVPIGAIAAMSLGD